MPFLDEILAILAAVTVGLIALLLFRPALLADRGGRILAFFAFFVLPIVATSAGLSAHLEQSKTTEFCLSCHVMEPYGKSLQVDNPNAIPASHFQNRRVPREKACFTCHTTYTMFGDMRAKLQGLRHLYVYYLGTIPEKIQLYQPYSNRECLHCHGGARSFEANEMHVAVRAEMDSGSTACLECHDVAHDVAGLGQAKLWKEGSQ